MAKTRLNDQCKPASRLGATKMDRFLLLDGATNTTGITDQPAPTTTIPPLLKTEWCKKMSEAVKAADKTQIAAGEMALYTESFPGVRFYFGGVGSANQTGNYVVRGWAYQNGVWIPCVLAKGVITLGARTYAVLDAGWGAAANLIADTITETLGYPGILPHSPEGDQIAWLDVDCRGFPLIQIATDLETIATSIDVHYQFIDLANQTVQAMESLEAELAALRNTVSPRVQAEIETKTTTDDTWDKNTGTDSIPIAANAVKLHVNLTQDGYLICNTTEGVYAPAGGSSPSRYTGGVTHEIPCRGQTFLHYARIAGGNNVIVTGTVYCTA